MECIQFKINGIISAAEYIKENHSEIIVLSHGLGGNAGTINKYYKFFDKQNKGVLSFDYPCHGYRKENYKDYTIDNCLKTIDEVLNYLTRKYPNKKINFLGTSLGSLYLYKYIITYKPNIHKVLFKCMPLYNSKKMKNNFFNKENSTKDYFTLSSNLKLPKSLLKELDKLESSLTEITNINKENILFIHGTKDEIANIDYIRKFCHKFNYNLKEIENGDHNLNNKENLVKNIEEFFLE